MVVLQLISLLVNFQCLKRKLPETYKIYKMKNIETISIPSILLEQTAYTFLLTYNLCQQYPLLTFFEYIVLFIQDLLVLLAIFKYSTKDLKKNLNNQSTPLYAIFIFCFYLLISLMGFIPTAWLHFSMILVIPICASSKIVQIKNIITNKDASKIDRSVWKSASYTSFARILTNILETHDKIMVIYLFVSLILNISIVIACTVYKYGPIRIAKDKKKKKTT